MQAFPLHIQYLLIWSENQSQVAIDTVLDSAAQEILTQCAEVLEKPDQLSRLPRELLKSLYDFRRTLLKRLPQKPGVFEEFGADLEFRKEEEKASSAAPKLSNLIEDYWEIQKELPESDLAGKALSASPDSEAIQADLNASMVEEADIPQYTGEISYQGGTTNQYFVHLSMLAETYALLGDLYLAGRKDHLKEDIVRKVTDGLESNALRHLQFLVDLNLIQPSSLTENKLLQRLNLNRAIAELERGGGTVVALDELDRLI